MCLSERARERGRKDGGPSQPSPRSAIAPLPLESKKRERERQRERECERARAEREEVGGPRGLPSPQLRPAAAAPVTETLRHRSDSPADSTVRLLPRAPPSAPPEQLLTAREPWRPPSAASSGTTGTSRRPPRGWPVVSGSTVWLSRGLPRPAPGVLARSPARRRRRRRRLRGHPLGQQQQPRQSTGRRGR